MIRSMTGFSSVQRDTANGRIGVDLRSVNHRFLECFCRIPDELRSVEPAVREAVARRLSRGKVEVRISWQPPVDRLAGVQPDDGVLQTLAAWEQAVLTRLPQAQPLTVAELLRWPGVLADAQPDGEALRGDVLRVVTAALDELDATRGREGARLAELMLEKVAAMRVEVDTVAPRIPELVAGYRSRVAERLREAAVDADPARLAQEFALFTSRIDIDEELGRLRTHLDELERLLKAGGVVGKRLDFLLQELNREANTLGSKSVATDTSNTSMALKVLIEQVREQVQNLE